MFCKTNLFKIYLFCKVNIFNQTSSLVTQLNSSFIGEPTNKTIVADRFSPVSSVLRWVVMMLGERGGALRGYNMIKSYNERTEQPLKSHLTRVSLKGRTSYMVQKLGFMLNISRLKNTFVKRRGSDFSCETRIGFSQKYKSYHLKPQKTNAWQNLGCYKWLSMCIHIQKK